MDRQVWNSFAGLRVLLLQGPVGPFFARVADAMRDAGAASVQKINFCGGDWLYYRKDASNYRGSLAEWPAYLAQYLEQYRIDVLVLFGDCRPVHAAAIDLATRRGLTYWVFEEGYIRPNYVTFERHGVNGFSGLPKAVSHYASLPATMAPPEQEVGNTFNRAAQSAMAYYVAGTLGWPWFRNRVHHRSLNMLEGLAWCRSYYRKLIYRAEQKPLLDSIRGRWSKGFFLVGLQTAGDSQVLTHSGFKSVVHFIEEVTASFAAHAPADTLLVIKHHPMDRGYHDYSKLLRRLGRELGIGARIRYVHDLNLPTLLTHARGVIVINSTVGLSALHHQTPVITLGKAIYDMPGLTFQGGLSRFWIDAQSQTPDLQLYWKFRNFVVDHTQLNGSFYKPMPGSDASGLIGRLPLSQPHEHQPVAQPLPAGVADLDAHRAGAAERDNLETRAADRPLMVSRPIPKA
ncbi:MAG: capsular biosynthesis protein [Ideonella sp.]